jgi:bifunctional NMN adenylyltransferase/nudix hydrolase
MYDIAVFIGRFQPFHIGHQHVMTQALERAKNLFILVGSSNVARSPHNPFTFEERRSVIHEALMQNFANVAVLPLNDMNNDEAWISQVQALVAIEAQERGLQNPSVCLIGYSKDKSSYYLKKFPMWGQERVDAIADPVIDNDLGLVLSSTSIRQIYFGSNVPYDACDVPDATKEFLSWFRDKEEYKYLSDWFTFDHEYNPADYPVQVLCADPVVTQSGHILLVRRKDMPGKGLWALPGGHVNRDETFVDAAVRELREETQISDSRGRIPPAILKSYIVNSHLFDDPNRSTRARVMSMAYHFKLPESRTLMSVKGDDDAELAEWVPLGSIDPRTMFEDHAQIIEHFCGNVFGN